MSVSFGPHFKVQASFVSDKAECGICHGSLAAEDGEDFVEAYTCSACAGVFHSICARQWWSQFMTPSGELNGYPIANRSAHYCPLCRATWPPQDFLQDVPEPVPAPPPAPPVVAVPAPPPVVAVPAPPRVGAVPAPPPVGLLRVSRGSSLSRAGVARRSRIPSGFWLLDYSEFYSKEHLERIYSGPGYRISYEDFPAARQVIFPVGLLISDHIWPFARNAESPFESVFLGRPYGAPFWTIYQATAENHGVSPRGFTLAQYRNTPTEWDYRPASGEAFSLTESEHPTVGRRSTTAGGLDRDISWVLASLAGGPYASELRP
jgi:hypothetical protein